MLGTLWAFVLLNNYPLAGGKGCSTSGGDRSWASLGMGKLGVGTGFDSVVLCGLWRYPAGLGLTLVFPSPAGNFSSLCTGGLRLG